MEETSDELPNFSIGIDLLRPDPRAAAKIKPNSKKLASCAFRKFVGRPSAAILAERHSLGTEKTAIYVFTVVFKFVMHFCYRRTIRLNQENFCCNNKTNTQEDIVIFLLIKTTAGRSSQVAVMTGHCRK